MLEDPAEVAAFSHHIECSVSMKLLNLSCPTVQTVGTVQYGNSLFTLPATKAWNRVRLLTFVLTYCSDLLAHSPMKGAIEVEIITLILLANCAGKIPV